jgi:hypothetical protein
MKSGLFCVYNLGFHDLGFNDIGSYDKSLKVSSALALAWL